MKKFHIIEQLDSEKFNCIKAGVFILEKDQDYKEGENILFINCPKNDIQTDMIGKKFKIEGVVKEGYNLYPNQVLVSLVDITVNKVGVLNINI